MITSSDFQQVQRDARFQNQMQEILIRWKLIYNQAKYIEHEHHVKDKQYGMEWRLQFFEHLKSQMRPIVNEMGSSTQKEKYEEIVKATKVVISTGVKGLLQENGEGKVGLMEYDMNGDQNLMSMLNNIIAATYQQQKKLFEKYQVVQMINNVHFLARIEVAVTYLRILLKQLDINKFLEDNPSTRQDIIQQKIAEQHCPMAASIFSSLDIQMPHNENQSYENMQGVLEQLLEVRTQQMKIQEDLRAIDRLKNIQQQQDGFNKGQWKPVYFWGYEYQNEGTTYTIEFDDQISVILETLREKCNKAKTQTEADYFSRVLISDKIIVDVVECKAFIQVLDGELPTQTCYVFRQDQTQRHFTIEKEQTVLHEGFSKFNNGYNQQNHLGRTALKKNINQYNLSGIPSWKQVKEGIMVEEIRSTVETFHQESDSNSILLKVSLAIKLQQWIKTFEKLKVPQNNSQLPISQLEMEKPFSETCQIILHLYTMDSIIRPTLNLASSSNDLSKVQTIGQLAACLSLILQYAEKNKISCSDNQITLYRAFVVTKDGVELKNYQDHQSQVINISGYTSVFDRDYEEALRAALNQQQVLDADSNQVIIFEIVLPKGGHSGFCHKLKQEDYTLHTEKQIMIFDDGRPFIVKSVDTNFLNSQDEIIKSSETEILNSDILHVSKVILEAVCFYDDNVYQQNRLSTPQVDKKDASMTQNNQYNNSNQDLVTNFTVDSSKDRISGTFYSDIPIQTPLYRNKELIDFSHSNMNLEDIKNFFDSLRMNQAEQKASNFDYQIVDFSYNNMNLQTVGFLLEQLQQFDSLAIEYFNLSGNQLSQLSANQLVQIINQGKLKYLTSLIIYDCPQLLTSDIEMLNVAGSVQGIRIIDNDKRKTKESIIQQMGLSFYSQYSQTFKEQLKSFVSHSNLHSSLFHFNTSLYKSLYLQSMELRHPQSQLRHISQKIPINNAQITDFTESLPWLKELKQDINDLKEELKNFDKDFCVTNSIEVKKGQESQGAWKEKLSAELKEEYQDDLKQLNENIMEAETKFVKETKAVQIALTNLEKTFKRKNEGERFNFDAFSDFYTNQIESIKHVLPLDLEEKNNLLLQHDGQFYDPTKKSKKALEHLHNKIRGEVIIKIDSFEFEEATNFVMDTAKQQSPDLTVFMLSIPCPTHVRYKKVQGSFTGKVIFFTKEQGAQNLMIRLNCLLGSTRDLIELRISKINASNINIAEINKGASTLNLSKSEVIGTILVPWKETAALSMAHGGRPSPFRTFKEQAYQWKDNRLYYDMDREGKAIPCLGTVKGRVRFVPYHQWEDGIEIQKTQLCMFQPINIDPEEREEDNPEFNTYISQKEEVEEPDRQVFEYLSDKQEDNLQLNLPQKIDSFEIQSISLNFFLTRKRSSKEKKYDYKQIYKGDMICHIRVTDYQTKRPIFEYMTERTQAGSIPLKDRGTQKNNAQSYVWSKQHQSATLVCNDVMPLAPIVSPKDSLKQNPTLDPSGPQTLLLHMTFFEITKQSAKQGAAGGELYRAVLNCEKEVVVPAEGVQGAGQQVVEIDCGTRNMEVKSLKLTINFFKGLMEGV